MDKITRKRHRNIRVVFPDPVSPRTMVTLFDAILRMSDSRPGRREEEGISPMIDILMKVPHLARWVIVLSALGGTGIFWPFHWKLRVSHSVFWWNGFWNISGVCSLRSCGRDRHGLNPLIVFSWAKKKRNRNILRMIWYENW